MLQQERNLRKTVAAHLATTGCTGCDQCARIRMLLGVIDTLRAALTTPADAEPVASPVASLEAQLQEAQRERDEWKRVASEQAAMHDAAERERDLLRAALEELLDEVDDVWLEETPGMRSGRTALQGESEFEGKGTA